MKILHTSDWHLGRLLHGYKRTDEYINFLNWLAGYITDNQIECLLISGDIFDSNTPPNQAMELYYGFLSRLIHSVCRHIIIIAGNHDSPALLNAPRDILKHFNIHITGSITENIEDEIIKVKDHEGKVRLIVCAVPFLRDKDIRSSEAGESIEQKEQKMIEGIRNHYRQVCDLANDIRGDMDIPIIAMGHLFTAGGSITEDDGVRELYIGSLGHVHHQIFPEYLDYVALGHLHVPQKVNQSDKIRYSGSPLPMGFGEARQQKIMCLIETQDRNLTVNEVEIPVFQRLESIKGNRDKIISRLQELVLENEEILAEVVYTGEEQFSDLKTVVERLAAGSKIEIILTKNNIVYNAILKVTENRETLEELSKEEVFLRCLKANNRSAEEETELMQTFQEAVLLLDDPKYQTEI